MGNFLITRSEPPATAVSEEVASTEAKQSSGGRGTTEYENSLAPRGASRHCNRVCAYYQRLLILFTCRIHMAVGIADLSMRVRALCRQLGEGLELEIDYGS